MIFDMLKTWVYDLIQIFCGRDKIINMLQQGLSVKLYNCGFALDVGGGTGLYRSIFPEAYHYLCLDCDRIKLKGFKRKHFKDPAIQACATQLPIGDQTMDLCLMIFVSHHLDAKTLNVALAEAARVLRPDGRFFFADAIWNPQNIRGRLLWFLDRGGFPKPLEELARLLGRSMVVTRECRFRIYHDYVIWECRPHRQAVAFNPLP